MNGAMAYANLKPILRNQADGVLSPTQASVGNPLSQTVTLSGVMSGDQFSHTFGGDQGGQGNRNRRTKSATKIGKGQ